MSLFFRRAEDRVMPSLRSSKGFSALIQKAELLRFFESIKVGRDAVRVSHLQFADDTFVLRKASTDNAKAFKRILRLFELASGLKVNYFKSSLIGINTDNLTNGMLENIVGCTSESFSSPTLGFPLGLIT